MRKVTWCKIPCRVRHSHVCGFKINLFVDSDLAFFKLYIRLSVFSIWYSEYSRKIECIFVDIKIWFWIRLTKADPGSRRH